MKGLQRYVLRQVLLTTVFVACAMTALISLFGSLRLVDFVINRGLPISVLFELAGLRIPGFLAIILPLATVTAVLVVYNRLANDSELVVMRSSGMSQWALARPALLVALLVTAFNYTFSIYLTPLSFETFMERQSTYRNAYGSVLLQEGRFNTPIDGVTVYARSRENRRDMRGIFAHDARDPEQPVTYMAERATATQTDNGMRVVLFKGSRQQVDKETGRLTLFYFDQYSLDLGLFNSPGGQRWPEPDERSFSELFSPAKNEIDAHYKTDLVAEGHRRLTTPFYVIAFCLVALAALLSGEFNRRGQTTRILAAIGVVIALHLAGLSVFNLAKRSLAFAPLLYVLPVAVSLGSVIVLGRGAWLRDNRSASSRSSTAYGT
ncbi:MAG: LPS export ABC transporter permease LptF [Alphaproteobacteria bacterium]|jgi:lipopolysaccharide export system permease protein